MLLGSQGSYSANTAIAKPRRACETTPPVLVLPPQAWPQVVPRRCAHQPQEVAIANATQAPIAGASGQQQPVARSRNRAGSAQPRQPQVQQQQSEAKGGASNSDRKGGGAWAERLLAVSQKTREKQRPLQQQLQKQTPVNDIFTPAPSQRRNSKGSKGSDDEDGWGSGWEDGADEDYDDDDKAGSGTKRLPSEMRCFDTATIYIKAGDGGNGCVAFRREAHVDKGGPAGGSGGRGGNVWAVADAQYNSLFSFRKQVHWRATNGQNGTGASCDGANAQDMYIPVPLGTIIRRKGAEEGEPPLAELLKEGERALLLVGGRGGRGNAAFKTARNNAPTLAEKGEKGPEAWVDLELRVVADAGIIGVPNAGKSTLLSVLTAAKPKIANYPFTTLVPNLGVCERDFRTVVFADVPGLLEGAHEGLGLGHEFLRHVSRCRMLVHVVDGTSPDPLADYDAINLELELFSPDLKDKPQLVAYNKVDVPDSGVFWEDVREGLLARGADPSRVFAISAATGSGVTELVRGVHALLDELGPAPVVKETEALNLTSVPPRSKRSSNIKDFKVEVEEQAGSSNPRFGGPLRVYFVSGEALERFSQMTNWNYWEAVRRFQRVLEVSGVSATLRAQGIREGDSVVIGDTEFEWSDDRSERAMYDAWLKDMDARGANLQGSARWPSSRPRADS